MFNSIKNAHLEPLNSSETGVIVQTGIESVLNVVLDNSGYKMPTTALTATNVSASTYTRTSDTVATFSLIPDGKGDITISGTCPERDDLTFSITTPQNGYWEWISPTTAQSKIKVSDTYELQLHPDPNYGYSLPDDVTISGTASTEYNPSTGKITIKNAESSITINKAVCTPKQYTVYAISSNSKSISYTSPFTYSDGSDNNAITVVPDSDKHYTLPEASQIKVFYGGTESTDGWTWTKSTGKLLIQYPRGNIYAVANCIKETVSVNCTFNGCSALPPSTIQYGSNLSITITAKSGYRVPYSSEIQSKISGLTGISYSSYTWSSYTSATLYLTNATGDVSFTLDCIESYYMTFNTTGVTVSPNITWLDANKSETLALTADSGYILPDSISISGGVTYTYTLDKETKLTASLLLSNPAADSTIIITGRTAKQLTITVEDKHLPVKISAPETGLVRIVRPNSTETLRVVPTDIVTISGIFATSNYYYAIPSASGSISTTTSSPGLSFIVAVTTDTTATINWNLVPSGVYVCDSGCTSNGKNYIDSGVIPSLNLPFKVIFQTNGTEAPGYGNIFGSRHASQENEFQVTMYNGGTISMGNGAGNCRTSNLVSDTTLKHTFEYTGDPTSQYIIDGTPTTLLCQRSEFTSQGSILLYGIRQSGRDDPQLETTTIYECIFGDIYANDLDNCRWFVAAYAGSSTEVLFDIIHQRVYQLTSVGTVDIYNYYSSNKALAPEIYYASGYKAIETLAKDTHAIKNNVTKVVFYVADASSTTYYVMNKSGSFSSAPSSWTAAGKSFDITEDSSISLWLMNA